MIQPGTVNPGDRVTFVTRSHWGKGERQHTGTVTKANRYTVWVRSGDMLIKRDIWRDLR